jgi:glycine cleavage system H protein
MVVILVLATFLGFVIIDWAINRGKVLDTVGAKQAVPAAVSQGDFVAGFHTPGNISYHPGHGWLARERKNVMRVGADEFAVALAGKLERVELPKRGQWLRQGQKFLTLFRNGESVEMVSPVEGEVLEVNTEIANNPSLLRQVPYGAGWLVSVHVPDEESVTRNLIPKSLVREWMRDTVERLYARQPAVAGAFAADGGRPTQDLLAEIPGVNWKQTAQEFFLTAAGPGK